jgi:CIC family chloride channel protein
MGAVFSGIARAPFTSIVFLFELSRNPNALLPLLVCCMLADGLVRLFSADSIMTGKLSKRGLNVRQDYFVPLMERTRIEEVMEKKFITAGPDDELKVISAGAAETGGVVPVIENGQVAGVIDARDLLLGADSDLKARDVARSNYVLARTGQTLGVVIREMERRKAENVVVVETQNSGKPVGVASAAGLLKVGRWMEEEMT